MREVEYRPAWNLRDPAIERDVELFWRRERALAPTGARLARLCAVAYAKSEVVATATAFVRPVSMQRCKLAMYHCFVAPNARRRGIATGLTVFSRELLQSWSREHPSEEVLGLGAIIRSPVLVRNLDLPVYPRTGLALAGYTPRGLQLRISWFEHARISKYWPGFQLDEEGFDDVDENEKPSGEG
jgi:hypothetical protein